MDSDIKATVARIDARIAKLRKIKEMLLEEFSVPDANVGRSVSRTEPNTTRKEQVVKLLLNSGPIVRKEILAKTGLPIGTIAYVLNDKKTFKNDGGRWDVTESVRNKQ